MEHVWVLGLGGMLGAAIGRQLLNRGLEPFNFDESFAWKNPQRIRLQLEKAVPNFLSKLMPGESWEIYWAAGTGFFGSSQTDLETETEVFDIFLEVLERHLAKYKAPGVIGFASSAGAVYSGCQDFEITEISPISAINDYATAKLTQEQLLKHFASRVLSVHILIARFSTLFGPGQSKGKRQGLLSYIARCALRREPAEIFVPLDTSRDYIFIEDAARYFITSSRAMIDSHEHIKLRIIAAERSVTISEIISTFNRLSKTPLRIIYKRNNLSLLYPKRVAYRSLSPLDNNCPRFTLLEGASALLRAEYVAYIKSQHGE